MIIINKRPDFILYNSCINNGATVAIDVSITHPVADYLPARPSAALDRREQDKKKKYETLCSAQKMEFQGFIFETYGRFSSNTDIFIKNCCQKISLSTGKQYHTLKHQWVTRISAILQSSNSYFITNGYKRLMNNNNHDSDIDIDHIFERMNNIT